MQLYLSFFLLNWGFVVILFDWKCLYTYLYRSFYQPILPHQWKAGNIHIRLICYLYLQWYGEYPCLRYSVHRQFHIGNSFLYLQWNQSIHSVKQICSYQFHLQRKTMYLEALRRVKVIWQQGKCSACSCQDL